MRRTNPRLAGARRRPRDPDLWQAEPGFKAAVVSTDSNHPLPPEDYKARLRHIAQLADVTVEVQPCADAAAAVA